MHCHACHDAHRATTTLLLRKLQHDAVPDVLQLHYYYYNYNAAMPCTPCYYTTTTDMPAVMPTVLLLHFYYENYNTLPCPLCYYYFTTTTTTTRCRT